MTYKYSYKYSNLWCPLCSINKVLTWPENTSLPTHIMQNSSEEIIDLTSLDYYSPCYKRRAICEEVIDLVNESFDEKTKNSDTIRTRKRKPKVNDAPQKPIEDKDRNCTKAGLCSICWEKLGKNPLASTKCGHVYCLLCLEKSLKCNKRCPTCRCVLKGASAYHPLYLEIG